MKIFQTFPACYQRQTLKNDLCREYGADLKSLRPSKKIKYAIQLRNHSGKCFWKRVGNTLGKARKIEEALKARLLISEYIQEDYKVR